MRVGSIAPFDWDTVDSVIKDMGYSCTIDDDGDHLFRAEGKIGFYIRPKTDDVTGQVRGLLFLSQFTLEDNMKENRTACFMGLNALNQVSSFCTVCLSSDENSLILSSYLPVGVGLVPSHLRLLVSEREKMVMERGTKVLALLVK